MTRSDTRLPAYAWGSEQKVATHPVAQLKQQDNPDEKPLQMTHRSLSPRTHPFHTIYDRYGNRNFVETNTTTLPKNCGTSPNFTVCAADVPVVNPTINTTANKNQLNGYTFDNAGNTTQDAQLRKFTYDAENKQIKVVTVNSSGTVTGTVGEYVYDGDGKRVKKKGYTNNVLTEETIFVRDAAGKEIAEYSTDIASTNDAKVAYLTSDHLGSPRINTDRDGNVIARHDYHPFGEEIATSQRTTGLGYADDTIRKQFTGYERDDETDLDFANARYLNFSLGRFASPDDFTNDTSSSIPQSWNLYAYVRNNPIQYTDPTGEKAHVHIEKDRKTKTGIVVITASFAVYGGRGQNVTKEDLNKQKELLQKQIESTYTGHFKGKDGYAYRVSAKITVTVADSEKDAIKSKADNIVEVRNDRLFENHDGINRELVAVSPRFAGESFDRVMISLANKDRFDEFNTYSHEFHHLLGQASELANGNVGGGDALQIPSRITQSDFEALASAQIRANQKDSTRRTSLIPRSWNVWVKNKK